MKKNKPYGAAAALLAGALLGGLMTAPGAHAVDFRVKGVWIAMLEYGDGGSFVRKDREGKNVQGWGRWGEDRFEAKNRVRLQLDAAVSDALSGSVYFEIGGATWGRARSGGALGADGQIVKIKHSYLDWNLPGTGLKARMGLQRIFLPDFVTDASQVFDADVAGISVAAPLTEHLSLTAFWARAFNDNWAAPDGGQSGWLDNADFFGLLLPVTYEDIRLTPWALLGTIGKNAFRHGNGRFYSRNSEGSYGIGLSPSAYRFDGRESSLAHATAFWAGLTGEITAARPLRLAWSAAWGSVATGDAALDRHGWYASALAEYALDWGTPGIYGWYSSGDDGDPANGSERMPTIEANNEGTNSVAGFGTLGTWPLGRDTLLGSTLVGTWGLGLRVCDISFFENLSHTIHLNYYQGTNSAGMARHIKGAGGPDIVRPNGTDFNTANYYGLYLTDRDRAMEVGIMSTYTLHENLKLLVEANYIALWLDNSRDVWGGYHAGGRRYAANSTEDAWNMNVSFIYKF